MERVVIALGGNALLRARPGRHVREPVRVVAFGGRGIADIAAAGWEVVVTHGNGPQVGRILLQQEAAKRWVHPMPLDVCGAESQGLIGYLLQVTIGDVFFERGMERPVATVLTLTRVRPDDPAFANPTKPIGPFYEEAEARQLETEQGWVLKPDPHGRFRRVVPSPDPYSIVEAPVIRTLIAEGTIVIASGGGGIPVVEEGPEARSGARAWSTRTSRRRSWPATSRPRRCWILTDVRAVQRGFGTDRAESIERHDREGGPEMLEAGEFGAGSMGPKVEAAVRFVEQRGGRSVIGDLDAAVAVLAEESGTSIVAG